jgi:hypothetical protein
LRTAGLSDYSLWWIDVPEYLRTPYELYVRLVLLPYFLGRPRLWIQGKPPNYSLTAIMTTLGLEPLGAPPA